MDAIKESVEAEQQGTEDLEGVRAIEGAAELLASIPPDQWTVVTSATRALAEARMRYVHLPLPKDAITAELVERGKPDPEPYLKGAALLGFSPSECLVIEDTAAGIKSAKAAGMQAIGLSTTYPAHELREADVVLRSCADIRVEVQTAAADNLTLQVYFEYSPAEI
jgi:sugar-phosphatase